MKISLSVEKWKEHVAKNPGGSFILGYLQRVTLNFHDEQGTTCSQEIKGFKVRINRAGKLSLSSPQKEWENEKDETQYTSMLRFDDGTYGVLVGLVAEIAEVKTAIAKAKQLHAGASASVSAQVGTSAPSIDEALALIAQNPDVLAKLLAAVTASQGSSESVVPESGDDAESVLVG